MNLRSVERRMRPLLVAAAALVCSDPSLSADSGRPSRELRSVSEFASNADHEARSAALFSEAAKVIEHARCMNCHPVSRAPTQGDDLHPHTPFMDARAGGHGRPGMQCATCHQANNVTTLGASVRSVPGNDHWGLAPASMAWQRKTRAEICQQLKDPERNGGRSLEQIREHVATDPLVGWAWNPGDGRTSAPGTQAEFGALIAAWIATGAACPR